VGTDGLLCELGGKKKVRIKKPIVIRGTEFEGIALGTLATVVRETRGGVIGVWTTVLLYRHSCYHLFTLPQITNLPYSVYAASVASSAAAQPNLLTLPINRYVTFNCICCCCMCCIMNALGADPYGLLPNELPYGDEPSIVSGGCKLPT
jgi:hypothetical protein